MPTYIQSLHDQISIDSKNLRLILAGEKQVRMKKEIIIGLNTRILQCQDKLFQIGLQ